MDKPFTEAIEDKGHFIRAVETVGLRLHDYFQRVKSRLMYFTECQLALVEDLHGRRFPRGRKATQEHIAREMIDECYINGCTHEDAVAAKHFRLAVELQKRGV